MGHGIADERHTPPDDEGPQGTRNECDTDAAQQGAEKEFVHRD
jgi:hypothetical protein